MQSPDFLATLEKLKSLAKQLEELNAKITSTLAEIDTEPYLKVKLDYLPSDVSLRDIQRNSAQISSEGIKWEYYSEYGEGEFTIAWEYLEKTPEEFKAALENIEEGRRKKAKLAQEKARREAKKEQEKRERAYLAELKTKYEKPGAKDGADEKIPC